MSTTSVKIPKFIRDNSYPSCKQKEQNKYFTTNALLVAAMLPLMSADERAMIDTWLSRLHGMNDTEVNRTVRNDYIWFLLVQLESGKIGLPFIKPPKKGHLDPVSKSIDKKLYNDLLLTAHNQSVQFEPDGDDLKSLFAQSNPSQAENDEDILTNIHPSQFYEHQPKPQQGFIVYGSCFSNQN